MQHRFPQQWTGKCEELLESLNTNSVQYLLIGSFAKELLCCSGQQPNDTDVIIACSHENMKRAAEAIFSVYPSRTKEGREASEIPCKNNIQLGLPGGPHGEDVHVLTAPKGFDFERAWTRRQVVKIASYDGRYIEIAVAAHEDLATLDKLAGREE